MKPYLTEWRESVKRHGNRADNPESMMLYKVYLDRLGEYNIYDNLERQERLEEDNRRAQSTEGQKSRLFSRPTSSKHA